MADATWTAFFFSNAVPISPRRDAKRHRLAGQAASSVQRSRSEFEKHPFRHRSPAERLLLGTTGHGHDRNSLYLPARAQSGAGLRTEAVLSRPFPGHQGAARLSGRSRPRLIHALASMFCVMAGLRPGHLRLELEEEPPPQPSPASGRGGRQHPLHVIRIVSNTFALILSQPHNAARSLSRLRGRAGVGALSAFCSWRKTALGWRQSSRAAKSCNSSSGDRHAHPDPRWYRR